MSWQNYTAEELEWQYNPRITAPDCEEDFARQRLLSRDVQNTLPHRTDIRYGSGPQETFDFYPANTTDAPVHLFIHGGYWRGEDKANFGFVARDLAARGVAVVLANYDLCPNVAIEDITAECVRCVHYVATHAETLGVDASRLTVSGHSAGGHLVAKLLAHDWSDHFDAYPIRGAIAISGLFDLEPVRHISINEVVRLTAASARANSPLFDPPPPNMPLLLVVGGDESEGFHEQTRLYAAHCQQAGVAAQTAAPAGYNHFAVLEALFLEQGELFAAVHELATA